MTSEFPAILSCGPLYQLVREQSDEWRLYYSFDLKIHGYDVQGCYRALHYSLAPQDRVVKTALEYLEQKHGLHEAVV